MGSPLLLLIQKLWPGLLVVFGSFALDITKHLSSFTFPRFSDSRRAKWLTKKMVHTFKVKYTWGSSGKVITKFEEPVDQL